ncbi:MAG: HAD family hydrolase [Candidatus Schekmanbacteria bacterium]|nr:HAD family hydrolase [Candidatus Schekmanbacteria bacterium]
MAEGDIRAVLFDMDGVLIDSFAAWLRVMNKALRFFSAVPAALAPETYAASWSQGAEQDVATYFPGRSVGEVRAFYRQELRCHLAAIRVLPGAAETLRALRARELRLACVTNTESDLAEEILDRSGLLGALSLVVGPDRGGGEKPSPTPLLWACEVLAVSPAHAVMVGDSELDVAAARAARMPVIGVAAQGTLAADVVVQTVAEVPGALWALASGDRSDARC